MRKWQVERRKRTRLLIELGGLVVKAGIVELTGDDRAMIYGALLWMGDKLRSDQHEHARALWNAKGKQAFETDPETRTRAHRNCPGNSLLIYDNGTSVARSTHGARSQSRRRCHRQRP
jgi:hypothetical protein